MVASATTVWLVPAFVKVRLPAAIFVLAYGGTIVIGAAFLLDPAGRAQLLEHHPDFARAPAAKAGGALYWLLLLMPLLVVPLSALAGAGVGTLVRGTFRNPLGSLDIATPFLFGLLAILAGFCFYMLWRADALVPSTWIDPTHCFDDRMNRRFALMSLLGNPYYAFGYASIPLISVLLLAKHVLIGARAALIGFVVSAAIVVWLYLAMIMKAPFVIYAGMIALTLVLCGAPLIQSMALTAIAAAGAFALLSVAQYCPPQHERWTTEFKPVPRDFLGFSLHTARGILFRMAQAYPYYIEIFSKPEERCGIEVPPLPLVPRQSCFPPTKVASEMYAGAAKEGKPPGYAPAPVHVSGLAEAGPAYAVAAAVLSGLVIGALSALAYGNATPLGVAVTVVASTYAYYATQVSFTGTLTDGYGLIWLLFPLAVLMPFAKRPRSAGSP